MTTSITIYCLEQITDYFGFERVCHDLMARHGFSGIEPLGGFSDKGRDAIHVSHSGKATIFAYSVREDWRAKLAEDAEKVHKYGHQCESLYFLCTRSISASARDEAVATIKNLYGWHLELFGLERLRVLLDAEYPQVVALHPEIFPPQLYKYTDFIAQRTQLYICHTGQDQVFAAWLSRKLTSEGYGVWCEATRTLGDVPYPNDIDEAIAEQVFMSIVLCSRVAMLDPEVLRQVAVARSTVKKLDQQLIVVKVDDISDVNIRHFTGATALVDFSQSWARGLRNLLSEILHSGCPKVLPNGKQVAIGTLSYPQVILQKPETLLSNCLHIEQIPIAIKCFEAKKDISFDDSNDLAVAWAHRRIDSHTILSFCSPSKAIADRFEITHKGDVPWQTTPRVWRINSVNLVAELLKKSMFVACSEHGLQMCSAKKIQYFADGIVDNNRLYFVRPDGSRTFVQSSGQRKYWKPSGSEEYKYYLAPTFYVEQSLLGAFVMTVRVRLRFTDIAGSVLPNRTAQSRRKHLCRDWWNEEWLNRILAICQFLASKGKITIGKIEQEQVVVCADPIQVITPVSIDEAIVEQIAVEQASMYASLEEDDDLVDEDEDFDDDH